ILLILITGLYIYFDETNSNPDELKKSIKENMHIDHTEEDNKQETSQPNIDVKGKLYDWIDKSSDEVKKELDEPKRKEESAYGNKQETSQHKIDVKAKLYDWIDKS